MNISDYKAAVFDFDGTIIDSMNLWSDIDVEYLARFGHVPEPSLHDDIEGMSSLEMAVYFREKYGINQTDEEMIRDWIDMSVYKYRYELSLKPYAREFISYLRGKGLKLAIATSTEEDIIIPCLRERGLMDYFDALATTSECTKGKPSPEVYLLAAQKVGTKPSACIAFEDLPAGILSAKKAGMFTVGVDDSFSRDKEEEKRKLSDLFIMDFRELIEE